MLTAVKNNLFLARNYWLFKMSTSIHAPRMKSDVSYMPSQGSKRSLTMLSDPAWKEMTDHQELLLMILSIREELIENVYKEYAKKYVENQSTKFVVSCALDAWKKIVNLNFLSHNFRNLSNKTFWVPDTEPVLCKPDSWSKTNLKINMKNYPKEATQQTEEDADYIFQSVPYPTCDVYQSPLKVSYSVPESQDKVHNSFISSSESRQTKIISATTVQFSSSAVLSNEQSNASTTQVYVICCFRSYSTY